MPDFLTDMARLSFERARRDEDLLPRDAVLRAALDRAPTRAPVFVDSELNVIAEIKRATPSAGVLDADVDVAAQARSYTEGGASAVSVLTEPLHFLGRDEDLRAAHGAGLPVIRKDFLVNEYQVLQSRALGADGVLLIAAILDDSTLGSMLDLCGELKMFALVEAFDERDLKRALQAGAALVGVNCRDLRNLNLDFDRFARLKPFIPASVVSVAESGITSPEDFAAVKNLGYNVALIGGALMKEADPALALRRLRA